MPTPTTQPVRALQRLRDTGDHSDLTIICGPETFRVHKCIVCPASDWFAAHCRQTWLSGKVDGVPSVSLKAVESQGDDEDLSCDHPQAVGLMLDFMYTGDYVPSPGGTTAVTSKSPTSPSFTKAYSPCLTKKKNRKRRKHDSGYDMDYGLFDGLPLDAEVQDLMPDEPLENLTMHARVYNMAGKYQVHGLKPVAVGKMKEILGGSWDLKDFAKAITVALTPSSDQDKDMRKVMIQRILRCSATILNDPDVEKAICAIEGLPYELLKRQSAQGGAWEAEA